MNLTCDRIWTLQLTSLLLFFLLFFLSSWHEAFEIPKAVCVALRWTFIVAHLSSTNWVTFSSRPHLIKNTYLGFLYHVPLFKLILKHPSIPLPTLPSLVSFLPGHKFSHFSCDLSPGATCYRSTCPQVCTSWDPSAGSWPSACSSSSPSSTSASGRESRRLER